MSKAWWFPIAILLCFALAEALICNNCEQFKIGFGCSAWTAPPCTAKPGQKCKLVKSFLEGTIRGVVQQGCTNSIDECDQHVFNPKLGSVETTCCDDRELCNIP